MSMSGIAIAIGTKQYYAMTFPLKSIEHRVYASTRGMTIVDDIPIHLTF